MIEILKSLIGVLKEIRTPLMFWGLFIISIVVIFYIFSKNSNWFLQTAKPAIKRLRENSLFRIIRLLFVLGFVFLITLVVLAFVAPLADKYIDRLYNKNISKQIEESSTQIKSELNLNENYLRIIKAYEAGDFESARLLVRQIFAADSVQGSFLSGYVVAAYFGIGEYKKAAIEVLERDKKNEAWDLSLKNDLAQCIRSYSIKNGVIAGVKLIDDLKVKYGNKLTSYFWTVLPIEFLRSINEGYYSTTLQMFYLDADNIREIKELVALYPNDRFIDHAYFALGENERIYREFPKSTIIDIATYGYAYNTIIELRDKYFDTNGSYFMINLIPQNEVTSINEVLKTGTDLFSQYIKIGFARPHGDDAYYWLGWISAQRRDYNQAMTYLLKGQTSGNGDYFDAIELLQSYLINFLSIEDRIVFFKNLETEQSNRVKAKRVNYLVNVMDPIESIKIVLTDTALIAEGLVDLITYNQLEYYGNLENCLRIHKQYANEAKNEMLDEVVSIVNETTLDESLLIRIAKIKKRPPYRILSYQIVDTLLKKTLSSEVQAKLMFMQISIAKIEYASKVDSIGRTFLQKYPYHRLADDVLASIVYANAYVLQNYKSAEFYDDLLNKKFPERNAVDNSLFWLALGYENSYNVDDSEKAKSRYNDIIERFPNTIFAKKAESKLTYLSRE